MPWTTSATHSPVDVRDAIADPAGARGGVSGATSRVTRNDWAGSLLARALVLTEDRLAYPLRCGMCAALAAVVEESRVPPPGARVSRAVSRAPLPHLIPEGAPHRGSKRKEGIVSRKLNFFALVVVAVAVTVARPAGAQSGGLCQLAGTAGISPGLSNTDSNFSFTFAAR